MTDYYSGTIDISKIKLRWEEPYSSEAANRQMTVHASGIYRGGSAGPLATPGKSFRIGPDADGAGLFVDSLFVTWDEANGFSVIVLDQDTVVVDMSSRFTGGGGSMAGDETWWVWQEATYATGVPSTAAYKVTDTVPPVGSNTIAKVEMLSGDTAILDARFDRTVKSLPLPTKKEDGAYVSGDKWYGVLSGEEAWNIPSSDHKRAMSNSPTAPTASNPFVTKADTLDAVFGEPHVEDVPGLTAVNRIQLSGWFYLGNQSEADSRGYFSLRQGGVGGENKPLVDADGKVIFVGAVFNSADDGPVDPSVDADSGGFYQNPWLYLFDEDDQVLFTGDLRVHCFRKKTYSSLEKAPVQAFPVAGAGVWAHETQSLGPAITGDVDSLSSGATSDRLAALLGFVNGRARLIAGGLAPGTDGLRDALEDIATGGESVPLLLGPGYHKIDWSTPKTFSRDVNIIGTGGSNATIVNFTNKDDACHFDFGGVSASIENVVFAGGINMVDADSVVKIGPRSVLRNCRFQGETSAAGGGYSVYLNAANDCLIDGCIFDQFHADDATFLLSGDCSRTVIRNCRVSGNRATWFVFASGVGSADVSIEGCTVTCVAGGGPGIDVGDGSRWVIKGNTLVSYPAVAPQTNVTLNISSTDGGGHRITENYIECKPAGTTSYYGASPLIMLDDDAIVFSNNVVVAHYFGKESARAYGVVQIGGSGSPGGGVMSGNHIDMDESYYGVRVEDDARRWVIQGNIFHNLTNGTATYPRAGVALGSNGPVLWIVIMGNHFNLPDSGDDAMAIVSSTDGSNSASYISVVGNSINSAGNTTGLVDADGMGNSSFIGNVTSDPPLFNNNGSSNEFGASGATAPGANED